MENQKQNRFKDLPWFGEIKELNRIYERGQDFSPLVIGIGGIGSWVTLALSRAGLRFAVMDNDILEEHNLGGQAFFNHQLGMKKVDAAVELTELMADSSTTSPLPSRMTMDATIGIPTVVVCCPDNMEARRVSFTRWKARMKESLSGSGDYTRYAIFIDARMTAEHGEIYAVKPTDVEAMGAYELTLFDDSEIEELPCSARATSHCGMITGGMIAATLFNHLTNVKMGMEFRDVPFKHKFQLATFDFRTYAAKSIIEDNARSVQNTVEKPAERELVLNIEEASNDLLTEPELTRDVTPVYTVLTSTQSTDTEDLSTVNTVPF